MAIKRRNLRRRKKINLADNGLGRVFFHWCCIGDVEYQPCVSVDAVQVSRTEPTNIYCPSNNAYGEFDVVAEIKGSEGRYTSSMLTRMSLDTVNFFHRLFEDDCVFDISIHYGECEDASDFYNYAKMIVFKNVHVTNYNLSSLVALAAEDRGVIDETVDISFEKMLVFLSVVDITETRIEDTVINSFSILNDNTCSNCTSCAMCFCENLGINTNGLQNTIVSWQDSGDKLVFVNDAGVITTLVASLYINNQTVKTISTTNLTLNVGETITTGAYRLAGTSDGRIFHIERGNVASVIVNNGGDSITAIYHKPFERMIAGDDAGNIYLGDPENFIVQLENSPTAASITAVANCDDNLLVADTLGALYTSQDLGETWTEIQIACDTSNVLSIECCDCFQFFLGTEQSLLYSSNSMQDFEIIHDDYSNYKHIVCCDATGDATVLAENGLDSIILTTNTFQTL